MAACSSSGGPDPDPDASTLGTTAFNVGMIVQDAVGNLQDTKVAELAGHVQSWLEIAEIAVVGLNEIHPSIAKKLVKELGQRQLDVGIATHDSDSLLWRIPQ